MNKKTKLATKVIRAGQVQSEFQEHAEAIYLTSSFTFASAEEAAERFANSQDMYIYSRYTNPTVRNFEKRLAVLEDAEDCMAFASGMGSILACILGICSAKSKVLASRQLFGATIGLFKNILAKFNIEIIFVDTTNIDEWKKLISKDVDLLFIETPSNPQLNVFDIKALANLAHENEALLIVDNCMATPFLQQPLNLGADLVMHSATKYIDGQGRVLGGAVCGSSDILQEKLLPVLRSGGITMSAFNAWVLLKGLETLSLRINEMSKSASYLINQIKDHPAIKQIYYPLLETNQNYQIAKEQQSAGGGIIALELQQGQEQVFKVINSLELFSITANFGDAKSTVTHPATTTHSKLTDEEKQLLKITPNLFRLSIGLENKDDLVNDLKQALDKV